MKATKIFAGILAAASLSLGACTNLNENLYDVLNNENIDLNNEKDLNALLGQAMAQFRFTHTSYWGWWELQEECSDTYCIPARIGIGWGSMYVNMHKHDWTYTIAQGETVWLNCYNCIQYCNLVLDAMAEDNAMRPHARFLRAYCYQILLDVFRNPPLITTANTEPGYLPEQVPVADLFKWIETEYNEIVDKIGTDKHYGWPNMYAVLMAQARLYLNANVYLGTNDNSYYDKALSAAELVLNEESGYKLAPTYKECFAQDLKNNPEMILVVPEDPTHASHFQLSSIGFPQTGMEAYASSCGAWNGSAAIPQFIDTYDPDDKRLYDTWAQGIQHYAVKNADGTYTNNAGDPIPFAADDWSGTGYLNYNKQMHSIDNPGCYQQEGYRMHKYEIVNGTNNGTYTDDMPVFRLSEAYFIAAECLLRLGRDEKTAADYVTKVRERSFPNSAKATRTAQDLKRGSCYEYGIEECTSPGCTNWETWNRAYEGGADIEFGGMLDEWAWEFVGEYHRRTDLIRFKTASGNNVFNGKSWFSKKATSETHWNVFPIPESAMKTNSKLKQNPGYASSGE